MELITVGALAGYTNSVAEKSPEELLRMNRRGAKLKLPGSLKEKRTKHHMYIKVNSRWIQELRQNMT